MLIFPKIVIKDGQSLHQMSNPLIAEVACSPAEIAARFVKMGFSWIYIQCLDSEIDHVTLDALAEIINGVDVPVSFEGTIKNISTIDTLIGEGVSRIILNNTALCDHNFIREACDFFPDQIALHLHADGDQVAIDNAGNVSSFDLSKIAQNISKHGLYALLFSDSQSQNEGSLKKPGLDMSGCVELASKIDCPVFYAGAVNYIEDLLSIAAVSENGIAGALIGEALYSEQISAGDALQIAAGISLYQQKSNDN
jgi:phosphoribosylformimino-5-aminoimidazole carboxamide ribotide isomerase